MAKLFYTVDEAAKRLGKSVDEVREMAASGQLQEFRDRDKLVFKREQVDLLAGGDEESGSIPLADSGEISIVEDSKAGSGGPSGAATGGTKERSGISIFEADELEEADASAQTQVTASVQGLPAGDPGASGSGILGVTRSEDTSLGAGLLEDVYGDKGDSAIGPAVGAGGGGALFESAGVASDVSGAGMPAMAMIAAEPYDGTWSGIAGGIALAMVIIVALSVAVVLLSITGGLGPLGFLAENFMPVVGGMAGLVAVCALVGMVLGKKS
jgi:excisionase family DNA binding protein